MKNIEFISQEDQELIDGFLNGQLDEASHLSFLERIQKEATFREKVEHMRLLSTGIKEEALKEEMNKFHASLSSGTSLKVRWMQSKWMRIAAAAVIVFGVCVVFIVSGQSKQEKLFARFYKADPGLMTTMSASENYDFNRAMVDYKSGNFEAALQGWLKLRQSSSSDTLDYFIGSAYLASGANEEAIKYFDQALKNGETVFYDDALWYKSLALVKANRVAEAAIILKSSNHPRKNELLSALNKSNE